MESRETEKLKKSRMSHCIFSTIQRRRSHHQSPEILSPFDNYIYSEQMSHQTSTARILPTNLPVTVSCTSTHQTLWERTNFFSLHSILEE